MTAPLFLPGLIKSLDDSGAFDSTITRLRVDRDGEVVMPAGIDNREEYLANPVVFWAHESWTEPIARATRLDVYDDRIESSAVFAPTEKGQNVRVLVRGGFLTSTSIGFLPRSYGRVNDIPTIERWSLLEYSVVPIPSNVDARITGVKSALSWLYDVMPDGVDPAALLTATADAHLTLSETPGGVAVVDRKRVIARIVRRRVLTI